MQLTDLSGGFNDSSHYSQKKKTICHYELKSKLTDEYHLNVIGIVLLYVYQNQHQTTQQESFTLHDSHLPQIALQPSKCSIFNCILRVMSQHI